MGEQRGEVPGRDLDGALDGKTVDTVTLRLVVAPDTAATSQEESS